MLVLWLLLRDSMMTPQNRPREIGLSALSGSQYVRVAFCNGEYCNVIPFSDTRFAMLCETNAEERRDFVRKPSNDDKKIIRDMTKSIVSQIPNITKGKGESWLWAKVNFENGRYVGGSTYWDPSDDFEREERIQSKRRKKT
jgi:hypothetical protein